MRIQTIFRSRVQVLLILLLCGVMGDRAAAQWSRFAGRHQNFQTETKVLPTTWGVGGPKVMWKHPIGTGDSSIVISDGLAYTMSRERNEEVVIALDTASGEAVWEHRYPTTVPEQLYVKYGNGPHATPLVHDGRVFTVGISGLMRCLDAKTGKLLWSHDFLSEFQTRLPDCGHSASAVPWKDTVIVPVGGKRSGVVAFRAATGEVVWKALDEKAGYATPLIIDVEGHPQAIVFMAVAVAGLDPSSGDVLWRRRHNTNHGVNASMPIWSKSDKTLFISSAYGTGSKAFRLSYEAEKPKVKQLWRQKKMQVHYGSVVRLGDYYYAPSGDSGPVFFSAINARNGEILWRKRDVIGKAFSLLVGEHLLTLSETGTLALASVSPEGVTILAEHRIFDGVARSAPTLVGQRLYVRGPKEIMALDLG